MQDLYPSFTAALRALGKTRHERARALGTNPKTIDRLLKRLPQPLEAFRTQPHLLRLLADDLERQLLRNDPA